MHGNVKTKSILIPNRQNVFPSMCVAILRVASEPMKEVLYEKWNIWATLRTMKLYFEAAVVKRKYNTHDLGHIPTSVGRCSVKCPLCAANWYGMPWRDTWDGWDTFCNFHATLRPLFWIPSKSAMLEVGGCSWRRR